MPISTITRKLGRQLRRWGNPTAGRQPAPAVKWFCQLGSARTAWHRLPGAGEVLALVYHADRGWRGFGEVRVRVTRKRCHFGSWLWWYECPRCRRRCGVLYAPGCGNRTDLDCRLCGGYKYESQDR